MDAGFFRVSAGPRGLEGGRAARRLHRAHGGTARPLRSPALEPRCPARRRRAPPPPPCAGSSPRRKWRREEAAARAAAGRGGNRATPGRTRSGGSPAAAPGAALPRQAPERPRRSRITRGPCHRRDPRAAGGGQGALGAEPGLALSAFLSVHVQSKCTILLLLLGKKKKLALLKCIHSKKKLGFIHMRVFYF